MVDTYTKATVSTFQLWLRWILLVPGALFAVWIAYYLSGILMRFALVFGGHDPREFTSQLYLEWIAGVSIGLAFPYAAGRIAPINKLQTLYVASAFVLVVSGAVAALAVSAEKYWALWEAIWFAFSAGGLAYAASRNEIKL